MLDDEYDEFSAMLDDVECLLPRYGGQPLSATARAMYFRALAAHDLIAVRFALDAHVRDAHRGRNFPLPADIMAQLEQRAAADGRPGAEEAWAIAMAGQDERDSVVWTPEIARAWGVARIILHASDEVGARMAFKETYARALAFARQSNQPIEWRLAEGHDPARRIDALRLAADMGRLVDGIDDLIGLPALRGPAALLLEADDDRSEMPRSARIALQALRDKLTAPYKYLPGADVIGRERTDDLRRAAAVRVADYKSKSNVNEKIDK